jgi:hypothetical protein
MQVMMVFMLAFGLIGPMLTSPALAASSRAATVVEVTGTAYLKKAGGSKPYRIYKKMTINQNDTIITEKQSSVVLSIVDQEDEVTIGEKSEVYVADLLEQSGGTKTTLNLSSGSVYSAVKPKGSSNTYRIETPNATMGVRGTHFIVALDMRTGAVKLLVNAGIVETSGNEEDHSLIVYPAYQSTIFDRLIGDSNIIVAPESMDDIPPSILEKLLQNRQIIEQEILELFESIEELGGTAPPDVANFDPYKQFAVDLVGNIIRRAVDREDLDPEFKLRLERELSQLEELNENLYEDAFTQEALELREQARKRQEEARAQREENKRQVAESKQELLDRLQRQKEELERANQKAEEEAKKDAVDRFLKDMTEEQREQFRQRVEETERDNNPDRRGETTGPSNPTNPGNDPGPGNGEEPGDDQQGPGDDEEEPGNPEATVRLVVGNRTEDQLTIDLVMENFPEGLQGAQFSILFDPEELAISEELDSLLSSIAESVGQVFPNAEVHAVAETGTYTGPDDVFTVATELVISLISLGEATSGQVDQEVLLSIPLSFLSSDVTEGHILLKGVMFVGEGGQEITYPIKVIGLTY